MRISFTDGKMKTQARGASGDGKGTQVVERWGWRIDVRVRGIGKGAEVLNMLK